MIGSLYGIPSIIATDIILVEVGGVGYRVMVSPRMTADLSSVGPQKFFIHTHVREDMLDLFGFATIEELTFFKTLLSISGIGPRTALAILGRDVDAIKKAVVTGDVDFFSGIPRLGKKNAQKIIIELRPKLGSIEVLSLVGDGGSDTKDVIDALVTMGFSRQESVQVIGKIEKEISTVEEKIKEALKLLGNR